MHYWPRKDGSAIADLATRAGADIQVITRGTGLGSSVDRSEVEYRVLRDELPGDLLVLAVPFAAYPNILEYRRDRLNGKVVIDIANAIDFSTYEEELQAPPGSSTAAELSKQLPADVHAVKAFNVNLGNTLSIGTNETTTTTVLFAGDDTETKIADTTLIEGAGPRTVDAGPLPRARELEAMGFL